MVLILLLLYLLLLLPTFLVTLPEDHSLNCVAFLFSFMLLECLCLPNIHLIYPPPWGSPSSSRLLPSRLNSLLTMQRKPCSLSVWSHQELESFLSWTNVILTLPALRRLCGLSLLMGGWPQSSLTIRALDTSWCSQPPGDCPAVCVRLFLGLFFFPLSFSFYPME